MNGRISLISRPGFILAVVAAACAGCGSPTGGARTQQQMTQLEARAENGSPQRQFELGMIYADSDGVPRDDAAALHWFRLAAEQGHTEAQYNLGLFYKDGRGVERDFIEAYKWFALSAARGNANAAMRMDAVGRLMTRDQIAQAQREAGAFVPRKGTAP